MPPELVQELARLLGEEKRLEGEIQATQDTLSRIKKRISESIVHRYINKTEGTDPMEEDLMKREQAHARLLEALLDMKTEIQARFRPLEEQIVQANVANLKDMFEQQKNMLGECLTAIDKKLLECLLHLHDYKRIQSDLSTLNEKLSLLGEASLPIPNSVPIDDLGDTINQRIEHLKSKGLL